MVNLRKVSLTWLLWMPFRVTFNLLVTGLAILLILLIWVKKWIFKYVIKTPDYTVRKDLAKIQAVYSKAGNICRTSQAQKILVLDLIDLFFLSDRAAKGLLSVTLSNG